MIKVHCDMGGCKSEDEFKFPGFGFSPAAGLPIPDGWLVVSWEGRVKGELTSVETAAKNIVDRLPHSLMPLGVELPAIMGLTPGGPPVNKVRYEAYICPSCADKIDLVTFHKVGDRRLMPDEE